MFCVSLRDLRLPRDRFHRIHRAPSSLRSSGCFMARTNLVLGTWYLVLAFRPSARVQALDDPVDDLAQAIFELALIEDVFVGDRLGQA